VCGVAAIFLAGLAVVFDVGSRADELLVALLLALFSKKPPFHLSALLCHDEGGFVVPGHPVSRRLPDALRELEAGTQILNGINLEGPAGGGDAHVKITHLGAGGGLIMERVEPVKDNEVNISFAGVGVEDDAGRA